MDHTLTVAPVSESVSDALFLRVWSAVDAADDYAQGANDRRLTDVLPVLREAARDLLPALSAPWPDAVPPFEPVSPNTPQVAAPAVTAEATLCRAAIIRLAGEIWSALPSPSAGPQTRARLNHLLRLITSLFGLVSLSLYLDQPETP